MSSGRRKEGEKSYADESDGIEEMCGVTDTKRTIPVKTNHALDPDVEADALISSEADERSCFQCSDLTGYQQRPPVRAKDAVSAGSGLQESAVTTDSVCYLRAAGEGSSTAGETVMLMSTGVTGNWNKTVVLPVDDQRTSGANRSPPLLHAVVSSSQVRRNYFSQVRFV